MDQSCIYVETSGQNGSVANTSFMWHILRLPVEFFEQRMAGDIVQRQLSNQDISNTLATLVLDSVAMLFNLVIMINYSPLLAGVGILAVAINLTIAKIISDKRIDITCVQMRDTANLNSTTLMGINMIETIKSAGAENGFFMRWAGFQANANAQMVRFAKINHLASFLR